jgi:transketolase
MAVIEVPHASAVAEIGKKDYLANARTGLSSNIVVRRRPGWRFHRLDACLRGQQQQAECQPMNEPTVSTSVHEDGSPGRLAIDTIRTLAMDAVEKANSGHPGTPMGLAPVGYTLWRDFLRYDPDVPDWPNRDRFVLSVGHASMLLYALLHLAGVREIDADGKPTGAPAVSLDDIRQFRQLGSKTPGHPEYRMTTGVETTTGPLGQGCGNSVGMAVAERALAARFNREGFKLFDHDVYVLCGDGDMMEGISGEAASLAAHLKLSNLCWIYDSNSISIEGSTDLAFTEDVGKRFEAYGWNVLRVADANDTKAIANALKNFRKTDDRPTFIVVRSVIGWGSPRAGSAKAHGEALGADNVRATKKAYGWPEDVQFLVPDGVAQAFNAGIAKRGKAAREAWESEFARYRESFPNEAAEFDLLRQGKLAQGWDADIPIFPADAKGVASRDAGGKVLNAIAPRVPMLIGGAADLSPSTKTNLTFEGAGSFEAGSYGGRNMHFGVREHAMGAVANGMALSYLRSYTATFLVFADYMRAPIRLASIMEIPVVFVFTHDSIGVGEDGPTHQPIEHLATLRAIPGLDTIRPGDANETAEAWKVALSHTHEPTALILSRQALPTIDRAKYASAGGLKKGAYVLADPHEGEPEIILIATGSELSLAVAAHEQLAAVGMRSRVVSMPSWYLFEKQDRAYRDAVLPPNIRTRLAIEQAGSLGWDRYVGTDGATITMSTFGASAPLAKLQQKFGFTLDNVLKVARQLMERTAS